MQTQPQNEPRPQPSTSDPSTAHRRTSPTAHRTSSRRTQASEPASTPNPRSTATYSHQHLRRTPTRRARIARRAGVLVWVVVDARLLCALRGRHVSISIVPARMSRGRPPPLLPRTQATNRGLEPRAQHPSLAASNNITTTSSSKNNNNNNNHEACTSKTQAANSLTGNQPATAEE